LGAVLYEMLCGSPPFGHLEEDGDVVLGILNEDAPHIQDRAPWVSAELALAVHQALARDPARRFATLEDFADALRPLSGGDELLTHAGVTTVPTTLRGRIASRADLASTGPAPLAVALKTHDADELGLVGHKLGDRFRVVRVIGKGGMGAVYEVEDTGGERLAAKVISRGLATENHPALARFAREAKASSAITSENVVRTLDAGSDERLALPYIIMELLHGTDMSAVMKREGALEPQLAVRLVLQAARGIAAAHARQVVHRDIKPANLFLQVDEETRKVTVKVCDFGVAKRTRSDESRRSAGHLSLTRTGGMLGSPMYMSPEQARNAKHVDGRADIWSLAVVLWEALTGKRLWGGQTSLGELIVCICTEPIQRVEEVSPWVPPDLARIVHKALERDLNQRTASMQSFVAALELFAGGSDHVVESQLTGLTDDQKLELSRKSAHAFPRRTTLEPPSDTVRVFTPGPGAAQLSVPPAHALSTPPFHGATPLHAVPMTSAAPESSPRAWLFAVIVAVLAAVTVTVVLLE
ncbi:MAG TPA: serine/threonine-protein kinase, partial [Polyangiaceae bacterium]